jgi:Glycosyltransferase family 87
MSRADGWRLALVAVCAGWFLQKAVWSNPGGGWDFRVYYHAAQAWRDGLNPYDTHTLPDQLREDGFKFNYPPFSLGLFAPFTRLPVQRALQVFTALKAIALAWLIWLWSRVLRTRVTEPAWVLFLVFAYSSTIFIDFIAGSVTTFEQVLLWIGFAALLEKRHWIFVAAVVCASLFRLAPIGLLAACLAVPGERRYRYVAAGVLAFALIFAVTYILSPQLTLEFVRTIPKNFGERGRLNPALGAFVMDASDLVARRLGITVAQWIPGAVFVAFASTIVVATMVVVRAAARVARTQRVDAILYAVVLAYAVAMPRFRNYHYMLLIVPTYFVLTQSTRLRPALPLLLLACLPIYSWITAAENIALLANYASWFIALGAWLLCLYELRSGTFASAATV